MGVLIKICNGTLKILDYRREFHLLIEELKHGGLFQMYFRMLVQGSFTNVAPRQRGQKSNSSVCDSLPYVLFKIDVFIIRLLFIQQHLVLRDEMMRLSAIVVEAVVVWKTRRPFRTAIMSGWCVCSQCESSQKIDLWKQRAAFLQRSAHILCRNTRAQSVVWKTKFHANYLHKKNTSGVLKKKSLADLA